jgi:hypothetical protein
VDKNRNTPRQLFQLWAALILALLLSLTALPMQAQTTAPPDSTMPPTAAPPPQQVPPDTAPNPPERAEPVGPDRRPPTTMPGDRDITERDVAEMDHFLDHHPEIAEQLRKDPALIDNAKFVEDHPALAQYLQEHPGVRKEFDSNPNAFMHAEERYDRSREAGGHYNFGITREEVASMDNFLDKHPEIAEQLRRDPSLIDNKRFVADHPALQEYLQEHPRVSAEFHEHPNAFMHDEERYDRREDARAYGDRDRDHDFDRDRDRDRREMGTFGEFLRGHTTTADALNNDPTLANNREFLETHPDLREYLKAHPGMQQQLSANPQAVMTSPALAGTTAPPRRGVTAPTKPEPPTMKPEPQH